MPQNLKKHVRAILEKHDDLRWDDAIQIVLDETQLDHVREKKQKARKKSGDFSDDGDDGAADKRLRNRRASARRPNKIAAAIRAAPVIQMLKIASVPSRPLVCLAPCAFPH